MLAVVDTEGGKVLQTISIGDDCDAVAFDPETGYIFASAGEGKLTIIHADASGKYAIVQDLASMPGPKLWRSIRQPTRFTYRLQNSLGVQRAISRPAVVPGSIEMLVVGR